VFIMNARPARGLLCARRTKHPAPILIAKLPPTPEASGTAATGEKNTTSTRCYPKFEVVVPEKEKDV